MTRAGGGNGANAPTMQQRLAQSQRDKAANRQRGRALQHRQTAQMRSIPKGPPKKKAELFTQGALKSFQFAPRGHGYYDAYANRPDTATVAATTGPATIVTGHSSDTIAGYSTITGTYNTAAGHASSSSAPSHTGNATLVVFNPGSSDDVVAVVYKLGLATPSTLYVTTQIISCAQFSEFGPTITHNSNDGQHHDGVPTVEHVDRNPSRRIESIPLRGSIRFRNITEAFSVGGVVRVLRYNGGLQINLDANNSQDDASSAPQVEQFLSVCNVIRDSTRTKVFTGHELREMHQSNSYPADFVRSMAFEKDRSIYETIQAPGYCSLLVLIDDYASSTSSVNNTYEMQFMVHRAARFGPGTILHGMAKSLPVKPEIHNKESKNEESRDAAGKLKSAVLYA